VSLRDSPLGELKVPLTWTAAVALVVAAVAATAVLLSDRRETFQAEAYGASRSVSDRVLTPVGDALSAPGRWTGSGIQSTASQSRKCDHVDSDAVAIRSRMPAW
jgi:rod shape-determining protein MreC